MEYVLHGILDGDPIGRYTVQTGMFAESILLLALKKRSQ